MSGYTIFDVDSIDASLEMEKACSFLDVGGSLKVSELMQIPG